MRPILIVRTCALFAALLLAACATHPPAPTPPAPEPTSPAAPPPQPEPAPPKKPKPHPKPAPAPAKPAIDVLAPEEVGYYMDVMQGRLKQIAGTNIAMQRHEDRVLITATAQFDASGGRAEIDVAHSRAFAAVAKVLIEYRKTRVTLRASSVDGAAPPDPAARAACEQALLRYFAGAGVPAEQFTNARADAAGTARIANFTIEIEPRRGDAAAAAR